jgi:hypothetical protein
MTDREKESRKKRNNIANDSAANDEIQYRPSKQKKNAKDTTAHHALVLQGGGALAAYEVGVYGALYFWRRKEMSKRGEAANNENVFDIIAGTSGGAINGWIIIDHVLDRRRNHGQNIADSWKGSLKSLLDFWDYTTSDPDFTKWSPLSIGLEVDEWLPGFPPLATWKWTTDEKLWKSRWDRAIKMISRLRQESRLGGIILQRTICILEQVMYFHHCHQCMIEDSLMKFLRQPISGINTATSP